MLAYFLNEMDIEEGFRSHMYVDTRGFTSIGKGTNLTVGITMEQADALRDCELTDNLVKLTSLDWFNGLNAVRQSVIENMCYNMGFDKLMEFKLMLAAIQKNDFLQASTEMLSSVWATQVPTRAVPLAGFMRTGIIPIS